MKQNPNICFEWNTNNAGQTQITGARCVRCSWKQKYPYLMYKEPWIGRFKREIENHKCEAA